MYGTAGQQNRQIDNSSIATMDKPESVGKVNQGTITRLQGCVESLDLLLGKVRGPQPENSGKSIEEMPCLVTHARVLDALANEIDNRVHDLHKLIGD